MSVYKHTHFSTCQHHYQNSAYPYRESTPSMFTQWTAACCAPPPWRSRWPPSTWCLNTSSWGRCRAASTYGSYAGEHIGNIVLLICMWKVTKDMYSSTVEQYHFEVLVLYFSLWYFNSTTSQRKWLYFLLHYIYIS